MMSNYTENEFNGLKLTLWKSQACFALTQTVLILTNKPQSETISLH